MATTLKNFISPDSPQYKEQSATIKFQILQIFSKSMTFITYYCTTLHFLTLGGTVLHTINTQEFHPSVIPGSKFKIPSQYFAITFWLF